MFLIRKVSGTRAEADRAAIAAAQDLLRRQFPGMAPAEIDSLPGWIEDPFARRFVTALFVAEDSRGSVRAAAVLLHVPELAFCFLEMMAVLPGRSGGGTGGALYERLRQEAAELGATGLYLECLPATADQVPDPVTRRQNAARLRFYDRFGARVIEGSGWEAPLSPGETGMPHLVFDGLGTHALPEAEGLRPILRAILERKYGDLCPPAYVEAVVGGLRDGAFGLAPRLGPEPTPPARRALQPMPLVVNDRHDIHHIRERGYVESPVRIGAILGELDRSGLFARVEPKAWPDTWIRAVHDGGLVDYLESACAEAPTKGSVYPYVFPIRNATRPPQERSVLAGYWCIDTFTPINRNAWPAARRAVDCTLTAAEAVADGAPAAYALVRPPGHHAERRSFGGFCYLSNAAIAANWLAARGPVAMLDIDYHHGNGQQDIFYERGDVLTVSIHGDPAFAYPYFTGFRDETGIGEGAGANLNLPLPETITAEQYFATLETALERVLRFRPWVLVLCLGFDTGKGDPTGTWPLGREDFHRLGRRIGGLGLPVLVVQEGGYRVRMLGLNARRFFEGLAEGIATRPPRAPLPPPEPGERIWRTAVTPEDPGAIRALVTATGRFSPEEIAIAGELAEERIAKGRASGYDFVLVSEGERLIGYACWGPIPGSETAHDLYWIAVDPERQGEGLGRALMDRAEAAIRKAGGRQIHVDTSTSPGYAPTRAFYAAAGYALAAEFPDFYRAGDGKAVFVKRLE